MQFTITLLPVPLSLVHIPRRCFGPCALPLLRQLLLSHVFFNITSNDLEVTLFTEHHEDFLTAIGSPYPEGFEINLHWRVLQVDSHSSSSNQLDDSGTRIHDLSFPLAAAGISILYQASYSSDFLFVQEDRLHDALSLLVDAGFHLYSEDFGEYDPHTLSSTPPLSPRTDESSVPLDMAKKSPSSAVLTRTRSGTDTSIESRLSQVDQTPSDSSTPIIQQDEAVVEQVFQRKLRTPSPLTSRVVLLSGSLACVGLSDSDFPVWSVKLVTLVTCPDLIRAEPPTSRGDHLPPTPPPLEMTDGSESGVLSSASPPLDGSSPHVPAPPFFTFTRSPDGSSLITDVSVLVNLFPLSERHLLKYGGELEAEDSRRRESVAYSFRDDGATPESNDDNEDDDAILRCLQIDLQKFGLDKHGLVHRFSRILRDHHIKHLYASTYKTANILVDKKQAGMALSLLQDT